jgi:hypothetical protein
MRGIQCYLKVDACEAGWLKRSAMCEGILKVGVAIAAKIERTFVQIFESA